MFCMIMCIIRYQKRGISKEDIQVRKLFILDSMLLLECLSGGTHNLQPFFHSSEQDERSGKLISIAV